eukprot:TRINITY_DN1982_c0_g2_i1.p1 TRINITY_DN1982_c0_g2~~TRINITY_DN1982_c0_g2_i1.p1  ORF type:complete len:184 (-),score=63.25 TRINITY_DN1982_c0_g2_i1:92-643(-)
MCIRDRVSTQSTGDFPDSRAKMEGLLAEAQSLTFVDFLLLFLIVVMLYLLLKSFFTPAPPPPPPYKPKEKPVPRNFTTQELRAFDGENGNQIYIGVKGKVYDVSSRPEFYGPGGAYDCFAGRDATRAFAKNSLDEEDLVNPTTDDLGAFEKESLTSWIESFEWKYDVVGYLTDGPNKYVPPAE